MRLRLVATRGKTIKRLYLPAVEARLLEILFFQTADTDRCRHIDILAGAEQTTEHRAAASTVAQICTWGLPRR